MYVQGRMKTSTHLVVGYAFEDACHREALNRTQQSRTQIGKVKLRSVLSAVMRTLTRDPNEPKVRQLDDRMGNRTWEVYDPQSFQTLKFDNEVEVRHWLEQRYYQSIAE